MKKIALIYIIPFLFVISLMSCQTVKPYQRVYLNDFEMRPGFSGARGFEQYVMTIREGASGGGGVKTSGGCGCN